MKTLLISLITGTLLLSSVGHAQTNSPGVDARQDNQMDRIKQGAKSGELTKQETGGLLKEQAKLRKKEKQYKSDGKLTPKERASLHKKENKTSNHIKEQKHDEQKR